MINMRINTRFFGEIDIDENVIMEFNKGIPGFEELTKFALLDIEDNQSLKCLQSIEESSVCLMAITPWQYFKDYEIKLSDEEIEQLEIENQDEVSVYNIITVRQDKITANLVAPIIINVIKNKGIQIILSDTQYKIRQEIPCLY